MDEIAVSRLMTSDAGRNTLVVYKPAQKVAA